MFIRLRKVSTTLERRAEFDQSVALVNILELSSKVGMGFADAESELADEILTNAASVSPNPPLRRNGVRHIYSMNVN